MTDHLTNRKEAQKLGHRFYIGACCLNGHVGLRYVSNKGCFECKSDVNEVFKSGLRKATKERQSHRHEAASKTFRVVGIVDGMEVGSSRSAAQTLNAPLYVGRPCKDGHTVRHLSCNKCLHCNRVSLKISRETDPRHNEQIRLWAKNNPDLRDAAIKRWRAKNPERFLEIARAGFHRRRCRKRSAPGDYTYEQSATIRDLQGGCCAYCGSSEKLSLDHKVPLSRGGSNDISNLQWLCTSHNSKKHVSTDDEYRTANSIPMQSEWDVPIFFNFLMRARAYEIGVS